MAVSSAFDVRETHGILWRPENRLHARSDQLGWTSLYASAQREAPYEATYRAVRDHLIILHLDGPVRVSRVLGADRASRVIPPGGLFLLPGQIDFSVQLGGCLDSLHVYVRDAVVREVAADLARGDPGRLEILPRLGDADPLIERLVLGVRDALRDAEPSAAIYVDYLARALAARLIRAHTAQAPSPPASGGLSRAQLARAVDYMEVHLALPIGLADVAAASALTPTHFARQFKRATGLAPHQHLTRCRIERAKRLLTQTQLAIADIALECGFSHQQHLTRMFRKATGLPPGAFRRRAAC